METAQYEVHAELEEKHWWFTGRRKICNALVRQILPASPRKTIMDVGCGTGGNIASLAGEYDCVGIDPSPDAIALAKKRFPGVRFLCGKIPEELAPMAPEADLFLMMDVLEHVPDDTAVLGPIVRAAKPGSLFLITVPADMRLWGPHDVSFGHYRRYDLPLLEKAWAELPVKPLLVSYYNHRLYPLALFARGLSRLRGRAWGDSGTDLALPPPPVNRIMETIFQGETRRLMEQLEGKRDARFPNGVSLIAVLRKEGAHAR